MPFKLSPNAINVLFLYMVILLAGCAQSLTMQIETQVPAAAMETTGLRVGVHYDDAFRNHVYRENNETRENWEIANGDSQIALFDQILNSLFDLVVEVTSPGAAADNLELVITPRLDEMQLAIPPETGFDFFEAWLKYTVNISDETDRPRVFTFTAYGKENRARFMRREAGLQKAMEQALRDAGAKLTLELMKIPQVQHAIGG